MLYWFQFFVKNKYTSVIKMESIIPILLEYLSDYNKLKLLSTCSSLNAMKHTIWFTDIHDITKVWHLNYRFRAVSGTICLENAPNVTHLHITSIGIKVPKYVTHVTYDGLYNDGFDSSMSSNDNIKYVMLNRMRLKEFIASPNLRTLVISSNYPTQYVFGNIRKLIITSNYNLPITLPQTIRKVKFGFYFNQPITLPNGTEIAIFGDHFNQPLTVPNSVRILEFGDNFNSELHIAELAELVELSFGVDFDQPITLPESIRSVKFGDDFDQPVTIPNRTYSVKFGRYYEHHITIPDSVRYFKARCNTTFTFGLGLTELVLMGAFDRSLTVPSHVLYLTIGGQFNSELTLNEGLLQLKITSEKYNKALILPRTLQVFEIRGKFNEPLGIPEQLRELKIEGSFDHPLWLPDSVEKLCIFGVFDQHIRLSSSLRELDIGYEFNQPIVLPEGLVTVKLYNHCNTITCPRTLRMCTFTRPYLHIDQIIPKHVIVEYRD
jgi:hypothetical protein